MVPLLIIALAVCERILPFRARPLSFFSPASERLSAFGFYLFGVLFSRLVAGSFFLAIVPIALARFPAQNVGFLTLSLQFLLVLVFEDFICYVDHRLKHEIPFLWRIHAVHHTAKELDGFVALRVHPLELTLNLTRRWLISFAATCVLGLSLQATALAITVGSFYNVVMHLNLDFEKILGKKLNGHFERFFFSPNSHSVHHVAPHFRKNCGRMFVFFDKWGGTYSAHRVTDDAFGFPTPESFPTGIPAQMVHFLVEPIRKFRNLRSSQEPEKVL